MIFALWAILLHADAKGDEPGGCSCYKNVSLVRVEGKRHERLADEVLAYFLAAAVVKCNGTRD